MIFMVLRVITFASLEGLSVEKGNVCFVYRQPTAAAPFQFSPFNLNHLFSASALIFFLWLFLVHKPYTSLTLPAVVKAGSSLSLI